MVIEDQQIRPIIHRCRAMLLNNRAAHLPTVGVVIWIHDAECQLMFARILHILLQMLICSIERADNDVALLHSINLPTLIPAVRNKVLQLHAASRGDASCHKGIVKVSHLGDELILHKHLTHNIIDIWRVYAMTSKIACAAQVRGQMLQTIEPMLECSSRAFHGSYFLSCPARRPVENAICML